METHARQGRRRVEVSIGLEGFAVDFIEGGDVVVPFEESCGGAYALDGAGVHVPDGVEDRVVVRVEGVLFELRVAGDVNLGYAVGGYAVYVLHGIEAVVLRGDVDVVDVEEDAAVGCVNNFVQELPLGHLGLVELGVAADVFYGDGDFKEVLHFADAGGGSTNGLKGVGEWEEIVGVAAVDASPAEVVGEPWRFGAPGEVFESLEVFAVERLSGAEVHGDAVLDDAVLFEDLVEDFEGAASVDHVIFGDDLKPVDEGLLGEDVIVVRDAKADSDTVIREAVEAVGWHATLLVRRA